VAVTGVGWERIPSPDLVEDTILAVISENNLRAKSTITSISGRSVIVRYVNMNAMPQQELEAAINYEADKYIPYAVDDVQLACQQLGGADDQNQIRVLLVAAKKQLVEEHLRLVKKVGITPHAVDVDLFALGNAFELCNLRGQLADQGEAVALVDIGAAKTSICIMKSSGDCFTREVYTAGNSITEAIAQRFGEEDADVELMKEDPGDAVDAIRESVMPILEDIGGEVRLSFDYYENQFDQPVSKVYLSGGSVQFPGVVESLGGIFDLDTVRFSPFECLSIEASDDVILKEKSSDMVVALGLASRIRGM
jgi:type IV pilus assembly protein PilM